MDLLVYYICASTRGGNYLDKYKSCSFDIHCELLFDFARTVVRDSTCLDFVEHRSHVQ